MVNQTDSDAIANVVIDRFGRARRAGSSSSASAPARSSTSTPAGSIVGHPALDEVVAVAAIDAADPGLDEVEPFSSRGPARVDFPAREDRAKPDLAALRRRVDLERGRLPGLSAVLRVLRHVGGRRRTPRASRRCSSRRTRR